MFTVVTQSASMPAAPDPATPVLAPSAVAAMTGGSLIDEIVRDGARRMLAAAFKLAYGAKFGKAVAKITDDLDQLLTFYDYPAEHWIHLRTTNPIESTFATVRHRTKVTKGPGSKAAGLAMAFKLIEAAQARWRAVNAPHLVALVRAGTRFERGKVAERPPSPTSIDAQAA
jgi:transposase-like protein